MFPKPQKPKRDKAYMLLVKSLPCLGYSVEANHVCGTWGSGNDAAHQGDHHSNRKASDDTTVSLCSRIHHQMHHLSGPFKNWTKAELRAWREWAIRETQERIKSMGVRI